MMSSNIASGGIGAVWSTIKHAHKQTGVIRAARALLAMNSETGFDCPGCAWPEPKHRAKLEFCENGAKTLMNATTKKVLDEKFFGAHSIAELVSWSDYALTTVGRLVLPLMKQENHEYFKPISYNEAFEVAQSWFSQIKGKERAVFYTSGRASNEAAFLYQLFARCFGTNNLCDCSNLCHESSGVALNNTIGVGKGTVQIDDFVEAQVIFLIGHNPSSNHPRMLTTLREARKNGALVVVINPMFEPGLKKFRHPQDLFDLVGPAKEIASHYFQVRVGGDLALFNAVAWWILKSANSDESILDREFINQHTEGFPDFKERVLSLPIDDLIDRAGVTLAEIEIIARLIAEHDRVIYAWGMGITQTTYGVNAIKAIVNLALLRGHIGELGAGLCPVRGHSNVQGNRTVGITEKPSEDFLHRLEKVFNFTPPTKHGLDVVDSISAMTEGQVELFMALGGNFLSASPDTEKTSAALKSVDFAINVATSLNRTHLVAGKNALVLPCLTRVERDIQSGLAQITSVENSMGIVHASRGHFAPIREGLHSEIAIIAQLAKRVLGPSTIDWQSYNDDYARIRDSIAACIDDFYDYNERLKNPDGFLLTNLCARRQFPTPSGRAQFFIPHAVASETSEHDLLLTTIRSHDQFNTSIYGLNDRYRGVKNERQVVFINEEDIKRLGLKAGMRVDLKSCHQGVLRTAYGFRVHQYNIKPGCAAAYFPEANVLVPLESVAYESNTPTSKLIPIFIKPSDASMPARSDGAAAPCNLSMAELAGYGPSRK
ncbi:MAG TPA: FdhF/YdeP family oxidoreductase [Myxococcota bacterium]|nr:FdhF/YdeP family oxidoreductase [Myxococcota bacterium]